MGHELNYTMVDGVRCYSPEEATQYRDYPDEGFAVTDQLERESFWVRSRVRVISKLIQSCVSELGSAQLLEIGCGTGELLRALVPDSRLTVTGSEIYLRGLQYAKKKLPGVNFIQFDAQKGVLPERYDIIVALDVLEHIDDDRKTLANLREMLTDRGFLIVTVPQHPFLWSRLDDLVKHKRRYTRHDLLTKLGEQGFGTQYCTSFFFTPFPAMFLSRTLERFQKDTAPEDQALESRVSFSTPVNMILNEVMRIDEALVDRRISLPFGGSLLAVARK
jgi:2-polyprenyl-3-methyl-5-hydroxy-6-metoxy-1,4-benzoquinol methylase